MLERKVEVLSKYYNYLENGKITGKAINVLESLTEEEKEIVLSDLTVQETIFSLKHIDLLRHIFRISPASFQEKMFENKNARTVLLAPRLSASEVKLERLFNTNDGVFRTEEIKSIARFLHSIKSDKVKEEVVDNRYFQMVVALCFEKQIDEKFFEGLDVERLFKNVINQKFFDTPKKSVGTFRKRNFLEIINKGTNKVLLTEDCEKIFKDNKLKFLFFSKDRNNGNRGSITIDKETFSFLSDAASDDLLSLKNIDRPLMESLLSDKVKEIMSKENFEIKDLLTRSGCNRYFYILFTEYYYLVIASDFVKNDEKLKSEYMDFIFSKLGDFRGFSETIFLEMKKSFFDRINSRMLSQKDINILITNPSAFKTIFYLKFNKSLDLMFYIRNVISEEQLLKLNAKHINQILKLMPKENEDETLLLYMNAISMYFTFGLERSIRILRGDYGEPTKKFFDNLAKLEVKKVEFKKEGNKYIPIINEEFNHFMFNTEKENNFRKMLLETNSPLSNYWSSLYNKFDDVREKCHGNMTFKRVNIALEHYSPVKDVGDISYDNYKLKDENIIEELCLGNKSSRKDEVVYKDMLDIYEQMKKRNESSIPYVKGNCENDYSYEMMRLNDPIAFTLGYKGNCCIRVDDVAHNHLLHATLCRNGRILIIYNEEGKVAAFSPLKRNGEVLIVNSIECANKTRNAKAIDAFSEAIKDVVGTSQMVEETPISLVCIGKEAYAKPQVTAFPQNIKTPTIYEKDDPVYKNTDCYHTQVEVVYKNSKIDYSKIRYGNPNASYKDPRIEPNEYEIKYGLSETADSVLKVINGIRYAKIKGDIDLESSFKPLGRYDVIKCIYSDDWYALITSNGKVVFEYLEHDSRAKKECELAVEKLNELVNKQRIKR